MLPPPLPPHPLRPARLALGVLVAILPAAVVAQPPAAPRADTLRPAPARPQADTGRQPTPGADSGRADRGRADTVRGGGTAADLGPADTGVVDPAAVRSRAAAPADSAAAAAAAAGRKTPAPRANPLTRATVLAEPVLPVGEGSSAAEILHVQVLLDAAGFSPGMLDARWGDNLRVALFTFRDAAGLDADVERVDAAAYSRLRRIAHDRPALTTYVIDPADVRGPYRPVPRSVADKARANCLCYESLLERLSERFHATPALLRALNPGVDFAAARPGLAVTVPNTWRLAPRGRVARVVVDKAARGVRGLGADGNVLFWLPATVGSAAMPSPQGSLRVQSVTVGPHYRWDPAVLRDVSRREPVRVLPPGPNNLVGSVWVALSRPHVGIHGTPDPEHVGYTASHGCVRLTNWDALWFSRLARPGLPVIFE